MTKFRNFILLLGIFLFVLNTVRSQEEILDSLVIYGRYLMANDPGKSNYELGVDSEDEDRDWIKDLGNNMMMEYPGKQPWGAVFITIGSPKEDREMDKRASDDFSRFSHIYIDLKGKVGGEVIEIALKDKFDRNNGNETKVALTLTDKWKTYKIPLSDFVTADLTILHVVTVFLFRGEKARTAYFQNVRFIKR